jgi:glc operon protein GlcG
MALTLAEAHRMMQAARAKAEELHVKVSVAVCDAGGNLLAFNRMGGARAVSATVAQGKAAASAGFGRPSGALAADSPVIQSIIATLGGRMLPAQGAVPMYKNGELVGALGGSGATPQQDEECAHAGGAALSTTPHEMWIRDSRNMPGHELAS